MLSFITEERLVEWLETLRLLGADRVLVYEHDIGPAAKAVLKHYASKKLVERVPTSYGGFHVPNQAALHRHFLSREGPVQDLARTSGITMTK